MWNKQLSPIESLILTKGEPDLCMRGARTAQAFEIPVVVVIFSGLSADGSSFHTSESGLQPLSIDMMVAGEEAALALLAGAVSAVVPGGCSAAHHLPVVLSAAQRCTS